MNPIRSLYCRTFQIVFRIALPILPYRNPKILHELTALPQVIASEGLHKPLIVTDHNLVSLGVTDSLQQALKEANLAYALFDGCYPNPTTALVEEASQVYLQEGCDSIIAFGGGSPMDLAKAVGVRIVKPKKPLHKMAGILKVWKRLPMLFAIPTTAGTGSETTLASVLIDAETRHKFAINDFPLIPRYAVLDRTTIHTLPVGVASTTGLDALTHAIEAYIGRSTTRQTRADAERAVQLIFAHLDEACAHTSEEAESKMLEASHYAGRAFTRSYVGYIHAVSHSLSGKYNLPHGWTNAVLLPIVLRMYGKSVWKKLKKLAIVAGIANKETDAQTASLALIERIEQWNERYQIPNKVEALQEEDIPLLAGYADHEANPLYPVPVLWNKKQLESIYREVLVCNK